MSKPEGSRRIIVSVPPQSDFRETGAPKKLRG
jgi:hypothetical protein